MDTDFPFESIEQALQVFAIQGRIDLVKVLLEKTVVNVNGQDTDGSTALMYAADKNSLDICLLLLEYGADVNFQNQKGSTALMFACLKGNSEIAELLIKHSARVDKQDNNGCSALFYAVQSTNIKSVKLLLGQGAEIDLQDVEGNTSLIYAVIHKQADIVALLIENGSDIEKQNRVGQSAITVEAVNDFPEIGKMLMNKRRELKEKRTYERAKKANISITTMEEMAPDKSGFFMGGIPRNTTASNTSDLSDLRDEPSWVKMKDYGIPFTTFRGWLKQIDASELNTLGTLALEYAFPLFLIDLNDDVIENILKRMEYGAQNFTSPQRTRRFAGDNTLPRGRYWSLSLNEKGDDGGTLTGELWGYYDAQKAGIVDIVDLTSEKAVQSHEEIIGQSIYKPETPACIISFYSIGNDPNPFIKSLGIDSLKPLSVYLPLKVEQRTIENVIDLRKPDVAQWFAEFFSRLTVDVTAVAKEQGTPTYLPSWPARPSLNSFEEILPTLLTQERGGGLVDQAIGSWCRQHGVNGLIYPSVRNDCGVLIENGEVKTFNGWNFVDYENAGNPKIKHFFDISDYWEEQVRLGIGLNVVEEALPLYNIFDQVQIDFIKSDINKGSWKVNGIIGTKRFLIEAEQKAYIQSLDPLSKDNSTIAPQDISGRQNKKEIDNLIKQFPKEGELKRWFKAFILHDYRSCAKSGLAMLPHIDSFEMLQMFIISLQRLGREVIVEQMTAEEVLFELTPQVLQHHKTIPELYSLLSLTFGLVEPSELLATATSNTSRCTIHYYAGARLFTIGKQENAKSEFQKAVDLKGDCFELYLAQGMLVQLKSNNQPS